MLGRPDFGEEQMGSTILLADDSITIQKVVNLTFADEGIDVVAVSNGDVAEKRLSEINPDLVLADIFMPGKNGYQLCEAIKQDPQFRNVPVVLLVGAFEPFDQAEARRVRADAHLTKPFESRTLVETVRRLVGENSGSASKPIPLMTEAPQEQPAVQERTPVPAFSGQTAPNLDLSAMSADSVAQASLHLETADDPLSPTADYVLDDFGVGPLSPPPQEMVTVLNNASDPFDPMELSPGNGFAAESQSASDTRAREAFLDLVGSEVTEPSSAQHAVSFEASMATHGVVLDASGDDCSRVAETTPLADLAAASEARLVGSDAVLETERPTFLAPDEPLGDVLFEEDAKPQETPSESAASEDGHGLSSQFDLVSQDAEHSDWTSPHPEAYSTAQLDSIEMPAQVAQYLAGNSEVSDAEAAPHFQQPSFSTGEFFAEEVRFTPIDIEAVAVEEADSHADHVGDDHGRGLAAEGVSPAAIEEIVRQVVAQMSDSVVREVAWEVVPDCVERVIERLARESLSKRM